MALLTVRKFKDKILKKRAKKVRKINEETIKLTYDMAETMKLGQGIGLAANQVGVLKRIIIVEADFKSQQVLALINPKVVKKSREKTIDKEGCLSFPGIYLDIKRSNAVKVKAKNIKGEKVVVEAEGILARVLQHEIDHLNGVLFYQRLSPIKRITFKMKYKL